MVQTEDRLYIMATDDNALATKMMCKMIPGRKLQQK